MKKSMILWAALLSVLFCLLPAAVFAESSGVWTYDIKPDGTAEITAYTGAETDVVIPASLDGTEVTSLGTVVFTSNETLTSVTVPEGVISIGMYAFSFCSNLHSIILPNSLAEIEGNPFQGTPAEFRMSLAHPNFAIIDGVLFEKSSKRLVAYPDYLEASEYTIPQGIRIIGSDAFRGSSHLRTVTIPDSVETISRGAFAECSLESVVIPNGVVSVESSAFESCASLKTVTIADSVREIGGNPFAGTPARFIVSPDHPYLATINNVLFEKSRKRLITYPWASSELSYEIPDGIREIAEGAFAASSLEEIIIPSSVKTIEPLAFCGCHKLTTVEIGEGLESIDLYAFLACEELKKVNIPLSVIEISKYVFVDCSQLTVTVIEGSYGELYCIENGLSYEAVQDLGWLTD